MFLNDNQKEVLLDINVNYAWRDSNNELGSFFLFKVIEFLLCELEVVIPDRFRCHLDAFDGDG